MRDFRQLQVWQKGHALTLEVYRVTQRFPVEERFGLTAQLRRAAASIPTNLAEGCGRHGERELARFVSIAAGSASLFLSLELEILDPANHVRTDSLTREVKRMLHSLHSRLIADG